MSKKSTISLVILAVIIVGGALYFTMRPESKTDLPYNDRSYEFDRETSSGSNMTDDGSFQPDNMNETTLEAGNFQFSKPELRVKQGETVRLTLAATEGMHNLVIDELGVQTRILRAGESDTVEFVANQPGTYEFYCNIGNHRQMGMSGRLIVE